MQIQKWLAGFGLVCGVVAGSSAASAALIASPTNPDASSDTIHITYTAGTGHDAGSGDATGTLTVLGIYEGYTDASNNFHFANSGTFKLDATIAYGALPTDPAFLTAADLTITDTSPSVTLFSGTVSDYFSYSTSGTPVFQFGFVGSNGTLALAGHDIGVQLTGNGVTGYTPGLFTTSFNNNLRQTAVADAFNVVKLPEPGSLSLAAVGAAGLLRRRRR